jgi:hypothetical protein
LFLPSWRPRGFHDIVNLGWDGSMKVSGSSFMVVKVFWISMCWILHFRVLFHGSKGLLDFDVLDLALSN